MVAKFVSVENFAIRAGLGDVDSLAEEVQNKARYSIEAATTHLVTYVRTEFDLNTGQVDDFYVDFRERPFVGEFPRFYLSRGFVTSTVSTLTLETSALLSELGGGTPISEDWLVLEQTKGTILITGTDNIPIHVINPIHDNRYFARITYDSGFNESADAFGSIYDTTETPAWLQEVAMMLAKQIFDTGMPCDDKGIGASGCPCFLEKLLDPNIRFLPSALKPMS